VLLLQVHYETKSFPYARDKQKTLALLDRFVTKAVKGHLVRRSIILSTFQGDITAEKKLHYELVCKECDNEDNCIHLIKTTFVAAIVPSAPQSFPGRNWVGNESAIDFIGLLDGMGLLRPAYRIFCQTYSSADASAKAAEAETKATMSIMDMPEDQRQEEREAREKTREVVFFKLSILLCGL